MAESRAVARDPRIDRGLLAQLTERRRRIEAGERSLGWKLGMGVPAAMEKLGTSAPLVGYMLESARLDDGATCSVQGWGNPRLEPEIAVHLGADVAAGDDPKRLALHEAIRRRYNVLVDRPGVLLAALTDPQDAPDGTR